MSPKEREDIDRRNFMKLSAAATAGAAGILTAPVTAQTHWPKKTPGADGLIHRNERPTMQYRRLGRTNFMASRLVFGCGSTLEAGRGVRLLERSFEAGINFYDVGCDASYKGSEKHLAPFLKAHRDEVWVVSKAPVRMLKGRKHGEPFTTAQGQEAGAFWTQQLEDSLKNLGVDYMDGYYFMAVDDPALVKSPELHQAFLDAKAAGKVGHLGVSTHLQAQAVLEAMVDTGWYDLAMIGICPAGWFDWMRREVAEGSPPLTKLQSVLQRAQDAGIGLVAMKTGKLLAPANEGGQGVKTAFDKFYPEKLIAADLNPFQRAYAYVLENGLDVTNSNMHNFTHLEDNMAIAATSGQYFA